jgi:predicted phosphoribosyltransferase
LLEKLPRTRLWILVRKIGVPMQSELVMGVVVDSFDLAQFSAGAAALAYGARQ